MGLYPNQNSCNICNEQKYSVRAITNSGIKYVQCKNCEVVYQFPLPDISQIQNIYTSDDKSYFVDEQKGVNYIKGENWLRTTAKFYIKLIEKTLNPDWKNLSVLDFGCATGILLDEMKKLGCSVTGIELSKWASEYARKNFGITVYNQDVFELNLPKESFDVITMIHSIEHLPEPVKAIEHLKLWLKPNGILVIATPDIDSIGEKLFKERWQYYLPNEHLYLFNRKSISKLLSSLRFKIVDIKPYLWRRRTNLEALIILAIKYCLYGFRLITSRRQKIYPHNGTSKDGMVIFARKIN